MAANEIGRIFNVKRERTFSPMPRIPVDDFPVTKVIETVEGTIQKTPVSGSDIVNKAYVDSVAGGLPQGVLPTGSLLTGSPTSIVFLNTLGSLTTHDHLNYTESGSILHVHKIAGDASDGLLITNTLGSTIANFGAGNGLNATLYGGLNVQGQGSFTTVDASANIKVAGSITLLGDNSAADTAYVPMILYNTDATPPAASGFPIGTLYIQYTA